MKRFTLFLLAAMVLPLTMNAQTKNDVPDGFASITLTAGDVWGDGSGYQMLLDANATAYGSIIPETGGLTSSGDASANVYAEFEYKIPENADGSCSTSNIVLNNSITILIPAGVYDWCITNPTPGDRVWIASSNGNVGGRADNYEFLSGVGYEFTVTLGGSNDQVDVTIDDPTFPVIPTDVVVTPTSTTGEVVWTAGENNASWTLRWRPWVDPASVSLLWDFPLDGYEEQIADWSTYDADGDDNGWGLAYSSDAQDDVCFFSASYVSGVGAVSPDNWLITPEVGLGGTLKFKTWNHRSSWPDKIMVYVCDNADYASVDEFVAISDFIEPSDSPEEIVLDLSAYEGTGYIAFRHYDCYDKWQIYIDDIEVIPANPAELQEWTVVEGLTDPAYTIEGLTPETKYEVQVIAFNENGSSTPWTEIVLFETTALTKRFVTDGEWNEATNWEPAGLPSEGADVIIDAEATIPAGYVANVGHVTNNGTIIIADGGQLRHTNAHDSEDVITVTLEKVIIAYEDVNVKSGYYFIAPAPFYNTISPNSVTNLKSNNYDFYSFYAAASDGLEWINLHESSASLKSAHGYLYANSETVTLRSTGQANSLNGGAALSIQYNPENDYDFNGWELAGNPYVCNGYVYITDVNNQIVETDFYRMNEAGDDYDLISSTDPLKPFEGVFVHLDGEQGQYSIRFSPDPVTSSSNSKLNMNLSRNGKRIDMARIRFGEGQNFDKMTFRENSSKIYMPVAGKDYASVFSTETMGEMPVSFKAENNGTYTLSFSNENVEFGYLHLIDNMTGADVDLLAHSSYSFEAKTTDYANRFKLVFSTDNASNDYFAYISDGSLVINNEGDATMNIYDITGRLVNTQTINGSCQVGFNAAPGVYMIQMVNGNDVKTQKIVVK